MDWLIDDLSFTEQLVLSNDRASTILSKYVAGSDEHLKLTAFERLVSGDVSTAYTLCEQLADKTHKVLDNLGPLSELLHIKLWEAGTVGRQRLQLYLKRRLKLQFDQVGDPTGDPWVVLPSTIASSVVAQIQRLPCALSEDQYPLRTFLQRAQAEGHHHYGPEGQYWMLLSPDTALDTKLRLLQNFPYPAALPQLLELFKACLRREETQSQALNWLEQNLSKLTILQAGQLAAACGDLMTTRVGLHRKWQASVVHKMLPSSHAEMAAAERAVFLQQVLSFCTEQGLAADWLRLRALHNLLQLQNQEVGYSDWPTLVSFTDMCMRTVYDTNPVLHGGNVHRTITCDLCGTFPIVGTRFRSEKTPNWDVCAACMGNRHAKNHAPYTKIHEDNRIYVYFMGIPPALEPFLRFPSSRDELEEAVAGLLRAAYMRNKALVLQPLPLEEQRLRLALQERAGQLQRLQAEAMLLVGAGDQAKFARQYEECGGSLRELQDRVVLRFAAHNELRYGASEAAVLRLEAKNVPSVLIKVYEINAWGYYRSELREVDIALPLAGVGATFEQSFSSPGSSLMWHTLDHSCLAGQRGVFLVEVVGRDRTLRALLRKGGLRFTENITAAGHCFKLFYEDWSPAAGGRAFLAGREYQADAATGELVIPFAQSSTDTKPLVLCAGDGTAVLHEDFKHRAEVYQFAAQFYMHPESLLPRQAAPLLLRASLSLYDEPAPLQLIEDVKLTVVIELHDKTHQTQVIKDARVDSATGTACYPINVPQRARSVAATLEGRIKKIAPGPNGEPQYQELQARHTWPLNGAESSSLIYDCFLQAAAPSSSSSSGGLMLRVLGRCGEPPTTPMALQLQLTHGLLGSSFPALRFEVRTDAEGVVRLGRLAGIEKLRVELRSNDQHGSRISRSWDLPGWWAHQAEPQSKLVVPAQAGVCALVPYKAPLLDGGVMSDAARPHLYRLAVSSDDGWRDGSGGIASCVDDKLTVGEGYCQLSNLEPGSYTVLDPAGAHAGITIIAAGADAPADSALLRVPAPVSRPLLAQAGDLHPLQILSASCSASGGLEVRLGGAPTTLQHARLDVTFHRFLPEDSKTARPRSLRNGGEGQPQTCTGDERSAYSESVQLDSALLYVLQRRQAVAERGPRPGNLLQKPSLLVHARQTQDAAAANSVIRGDDGGRARDRAGAEESYRFVDHAGEKCMATTAVPLGSYGGGGGSGPPTLTFCKPAHVLHGLTCGPDGRLLLTAQQLAAAGLDVAASGHTFVTVQAAAEPVSTHVAVATSAIEGACRTSAAPLEDMGLSCSLPVTAICTQACDVTCLPPGGQLVIEDASGAQYNVFDGPQKVWDLFDTLLKHGNVRHPSGRAASALWAEFDLLPRWHSLSPAVKLEKASKLACAELHFYLALKDAPFFESAVLPLLRNKLPGARTFMDCWLLVAAGDRSIALQDYLLPHRYANLNALERILLASSMGVEHLQRLARDMKATCAAADMQGGIKATERSERLFAMALACGAQSAEDQAAAAAAGKHRQLSRRTDRDEQGSRATLEEEDDEGWTDVTDSARMDGCDTVAPRYSRTSPAYTPVVQNYALGAPVGGFAFGSAMRPRGMAATFLQGGEVTRGAPMPQQQAVPFGAAVPPAALARAAPDHMKAMKKRAEVSKEVDRHYKPVLDTKEWTEGGYYKMETVGAPNHALLPVSHFWADYAQHLADAHALGSFLPASLTTAAGTFTSAVCAMAVLGLQPATAASHGHVVQYAGGRVALQAIAPCIVFHKQLRPRVDLTQEPRPAVLPTVNVADYLYDPANQFEEDPETGEQREVVLSGVPLLAGKVYTRRVVITSVVSSRQQLSVLVQAPEGAHPLQGEPRCKTCSISNEGYSVHQITLSYYFPRPGNYGQYAASVSKRGRLVWLPERLQPVLRVLTELPPQAAGDTAFDWAKHARTADDTKILEYLTSGDLSKVTDFSIIGPRCLSTSFYKAATDALRTRFTFPTVLWRYSVLHMDEQTLREYLPQTELGATAGIAYASFSGGGAGGYLRPGALLLPISAEDQGYSHREYWPLINAYVHVLRKHSELPSVLQDNLVVRRQYKRLLARLLCQPQLLPLDALELCQHFIVQERIDEAEQLLGRFWQQLQQLQPGSPAHMQLTHMAAWLDLSARDTDTDLSAARRAAAAYQDCPDVQWRKRFRELRSLLQEIDAGSSSSSGGNAAVAVDAAADGGGDAAGDVAMVPGGEGEEAEPEAAAAPVMLDASLDKAGKLALRSSGITEVTVNMYEIDVELLFTLQPFKVMSQGNSGRAAGIGIGGSNGKDSGDQLSQVSFVKPSRTAVVPMLQPAAAPAGQARSAASREQLVDLDALFPNIANRSALVEVMGRGTNKSLPRYCSSIQLSMFEAHGVLQATASGATAAASEQQHFIVGAYVKVFATPVGGSTSDAWFYKDGYTDRRGKFDYSSATGSKKAAAFAVLVTAPGHGSVIAQVKAPQ